MLHLMTLFQPMKTLYARYVLPVQTAYDITRTELDILLFLANNPQYDTAKDIVEVRKITKSHVSTSLKALTDAGYLRGYYTEGNRKVVHLALLPAAMPVVRAGQKAQRAFQEQVYHGISPDDLETMSRCLMAMAENVRTEEASK